MRVLVTGATGLVGNNVVRLLLAAGRPVRVLTRATSAARPLAGLDLEIVRGEMREPASLAAAVEGCGLVIHAAAHVHIGWTGLDAARAINVGGTATLAAAARAAGARLVHVSSVDALGFRTLTEPADEETPPTNGVLCPYVVTKREAEQALLAEVERGLDATIVNPTYMLGPWDWKPSSGRMLLHVSRGWALAAPRGWNNFCDVRDVAAGILAAAERGQRGRRYILGGETLSYLEAWRLFAAVSGARRPLFKVGAVPRTLAGWGGDLWTRLTGREPDVNSAATAIAGQPRHFTSARAQAELNYTARPVREAAEGAWQWFCDHGYA